MLKNLMTQIRTITESASGPFSCLDCAGQKQTWIQTRNALDFQMTWIFQYPGIGLYKPLVVSTDTTLRLSVYAQ